MPFALFCFAQKVLGSIYKYDTGLLCIFIIAIVWQWTHTVIIRGVSRTWSMGVLKFKERPNCFLRNNLSVYSLPADCACSKGHEPMFVLVHVVFSGGNLFTCVQLQMEETHKTSCVWIQDNCSSFLASKSATIKTSNLLCEGYPCCKRSAVISRWVDPEYTNKQTNRLIYYTRGHPRVPYAISKTPKGSLTTSRS